MFQTLKELPEGLLNWDLNKYNTNKYTKVDRAQFRRPPLYIQATAMEESREHEIVFSVDEHRKLGQCQTVGHECIHITHII